MRKLLFILTVCFIALLCVRAAFGNNQPFKTMDIIGYLSEAVVTETTFQDVVQTLTNVNNFFKKGTTECEEIIFSTDNILVGAYYVLTDIIIVIVQVVALLVSAVLCLVPLLVSVVIDALLILRVVYFLIFGIPI